MVPRWRALANTPKAEVVSANNVSRPQTLIDLPEKLAAWEARRDIISASELMELAPFVGRGEEIGDAIDFLSQRRDELTPGVLQMLERLGRSESPPSEVSEIVTEGQHRASIRRLKQSSQAYSRNPILRVELARHYVSMGQTEPAEAAFRYALALAPRNRYVLRCATRFFIHAGNPDHAWPFLRDAPTNDPWLLACRIALADILDKPQDKIRAARGLLESSNPTHITELAASLGTLELSNGSIKQARKLFRQSALDPNDNTVAQLGWAHEKASIPFDDDLLKTELSFEARTREAVKSKEWQKGLRNAQLWQLDEPFSSRPTLVGCFIAAEIERSFDVAEKIASTGLMSMPNDATLLNNRAYARINIGRIVEARADLESAWLRHPSPHTAVYLTATEGCLLYREGKFEEGSAKYSSAIELARSRGEKVSVQAALIHWLSEDLRAGMVLTPHDEDLIERIFSDENHISDETRAIFRSNIDAAVRDREYALNATRRAHQGVNSIISSKSAPPALALPSPADWSKLWN